MRDARSFLASNPSLHHPFAEGRGARRPLRCPGRCRPGDRAILGGTTEPARGLDVPIGHQTEITEDGRQIRGRELLELFEEWITLADAVEPALPAEVDLFFRRLAEAKEGDGAGRVER